MGTGTRALATVAAAEVLLTAAAAPATTPPGCNDATTQAPVLYVLDGNWAVGPTAPLIVTQMDPMQQIQPYVQASVGYAGEEAHDWDRLCNKDFVSPGEPIAKALIDAVAMGLEAGARTREEADAASACAGVSRDASHGRGPDRRAHSTRRACARARGRGWTGDEGVRRYVEFSVASGVARADAEAARSFIEEQLHILTPDEDRAVLQEAGFTDVTEFYTALTFRGWVGYA